MLHLLRSSHCSGHTTFVDLHALLIGYVKDAVLVYAVRLGRLQVRGKDTASLSAPCYLSGPHHDLDAPKNGRREARADDGCAIGQCDGE